MLTKVLSLAALIGAGILFAATAFAGAGDYKFDLVSARPASGKTDVTVRLTHVPDSKPVGGAIIFQPKAIMVGMENMSAAATVELGPQPGTYVLHVATGMAGPWLLNLSAKVQGESETVRAAVQFEAAQ